MNENQLTILMCDDDENILKGRKSLIEMQGYKVLTCSSGKDAIEIVRNSKIHILVLDYFMPGLSGEDVVNEIRKFDIEIFIIISTAFSKDVPPLELMGKLKIHEYHDKNDGPNRLLLAINSGANTWAQINEMKKLFKLSTTDGLTGLYNRRYLFETAEKELTASKRYKRNLSVLMLDIDYFKKFNDTYGHKTGDEVLKAVASTLAKTTRVDVDIVGRYGGEEFAIVLPETDLIQAKQLGERLRQNVEQITLISEMPELRITISIGVAAFDSEQEETTLEGLFKQADAMLYKAKENGRNRVEG